MNGSERDIADLLLQLYKGAIEYTHTNEGDPAHRKSYDTLFNAAHDLAFWCGGADKLEGLLNHWLEKK